MPARRYRHLWIEAEDSAGNPVRAVTYIADGNAVGGNPSLRYITTTRRRERRAYRSIGFGCWIASKRRNDRHACWCTQCRRVLRRRVSNQRSAAPQACSNGDFSADLTIRGPDHEGQLRVEPCPPRAIR